MDLEKFYFTYGSDDVQPYCGGWTVVWAPNYHMACQAFRAVHPDRIPNVLNCASVYSAKEFEKTKMFGSEVNFGEEIEDSYNGQIDELTVQNEDLREKLEDIREVCRE